MVILPSVLLHNQHDVSCVLAHRLRDTNITPLRPSFNSHEKRLTFIQVPTLVLHADFSTETTWVFAGGGKSGGSSNLARLWYRALPDHAAL